MIIPLGISREWCATTEEVTTALSGWSVSPAGDVIVGGVSQAGTTRRLSDLLTGIFADGRSCSVYLADMAAARAAVARGDDPVLYRAYRDILSPRAKPGAPAPASSAGTGYWFADLVIYQGGELPGSRELTRSVGHWNTPAQLEVFQCLSGRVLILSSTRDVLGRRGLTYQVCGPGELAVLEFGAWHLTAVLTGPAAVFNIYTDAHTLGHGHTSRDAAEQDHLKYHSRAPVKIAAIHTDQGIALIGDPSELGIHPRILQASTPKWARGLLGPGGLAALYQHAPDAELAQLLRLALTHSPQPRARLAATTAGSTG
ncbi:MAG: hypothetical protein ACRDTA_04345 [Pseudonocardiaceae bacterium]